MDQMLAVPIFWPPPYLSSPWNSSELMRLRLVLCASSMSWSPVLPEGSAGLSYMCGFSSVSGGDRIGSGYQNLYSPHLPYNIHECVCSARSSFLSISGKTGCCQTFKVWHCMASLCDGHWRTRDDLATIVIQLPLFRIGSIRICLVAAVKEFSPCHNHTL